MDNGVKKYFYLLALTKQKENSSVFEWCPFSGGDRLGKIISEHNKRCINYYKQWDWLPKDISEYCRGIKTYSYNPSKIDEIKFGEISILMIDIDTLFDQNSDNKELIEKIKIKMANANKRYNLIQTSQKKDSISKRGVFKYLPVAPSSPEIFRSQDKLEQYLGNFCEVYGDTVNIMLTEKSKIDYLLSNENISAKWDKIDISKIASDVRDTALAKGLNKSNVEEIKTLTYKTTVREHAIVGAVEEFITGKKEQFKSPYYIVTDQIRNIDEIPIEPSYEEPGLKSSSLLLLSLNKQYEKLTKTEKSLVLDLGLETDRNVSVYFDEPVIRNRVECLSDIVKTSKFKADLFHWDKIP